jgi:hypothetical protein
MIFFLVGPRDTCVAAPNFFFLIFVLGPGGSDGGIERSGGRWRDVAQRRKEDSMLNKFVFPLFYEFFLHFLFCCSVFPAISVLPAGKLIPTPILFSPGSPETL